MLSTARATSQNSGLSSDTNDSGGELLVAGKLPLTGELVNKGVRLFEWLLDAHLTIEQRSLLRNCLVGIWNTHRQRDIDDAAKALNFQDQVNSKSPEERAVIRGALSEMFVASARQKPNDVFAQWMLNIYDSAHRPIANGNPPLTAQVADAYAEFVSFVLRDAWAEVRSIPTVISKTHSPMVSQRSTRVTHPSSSSSSPKCRFFGSSCG